MLSLTTSTKWFGPTAPFGSGGAELTLNVPDGPLKPWPTPSTPRPSAGAAATPGLACTTGSGPPDSGAGGPCFGSLFFFSLPDVGARTMPPRGGETSWCTAGLSVVLRTALEPAAPLV